MGKKEVWWKDMFRAEKEHVIMFVLFMSAYFLFTWVSLEGGKKERQEKEDLVREICGVDLNDWEKSREIRGK